LEIKGETSHARDKYKDKLTVLLCYNLDGSAKLHPLVMGKSDKSHCMKNIKKFPSECKASQHA